MSAWPMVSRCFERQWLGLSSCERETLRYNWQLERLPSASALRSESAGQVETPIWLVSFPNLASLTLMSVKEDQPWDVWSSRCC